MAGRGGGSRAAGTGSGIGATGAGAGGGIGLLAGVRASVGGSGSQAFGLSSELQVPVHGHAERTALFRERECALPRRVAER